MKTFLYLFFILSISYFITVLNLEPLNVWKENFNILSYYYHSIGEVSKAENFYRLYCFFNIIYDYKILIRAFVYIYFIFVLILIVRNRVKKPIIQIKFFIYCYILFFILIAILLNFKLSWALYIVLSITLLITFYLILNHFIKKQSVIHVTNMIGEIVFISFFIFLSILSYQKVVLYHAQFDFPKEMVIKDDMNYGVGDRERPVCRNENGTIKCLSVFGYSSYYRQYKLKEIRIYAKNTTLIDQVSNDEFNFIIGYNLQLINIIKEQITIEDQMIIIDIEDNINALARDDQPFNYIFIYSNNKENDHPINSLLVDHYEFLVQKE